jgi:hypothetical protein
VAAAISGDDRLSNGVLLGIEKDTTENVLWRVNNGEGLGAREPKPSSAYVLAGANDFFAYFPPRATFAVAADSVAISISIAERVANTTQSIVASLKKQSCSTRVVVVGLLPGFLSEQEGSAGFPEAAGIVNDMLLNWTADVFGAEFLDCSSHVLARAEQGARLFHRKCS